MKFDCVLGTTFDFYKQKCSRSAGVCYEPVCSGRTDGAYQDTTHACRRSFTCRGGSLISLDNCPYGKLHNGESCQPQEYVVCDLPESTAIAYPYAGDKRCLGLSNGNHGVEDKDCRKYIICRDEEVEDDLQCPIGLRFDSISRRCLVAHAVTCSDSRNNDICYHMPDGTHSDMSSEDCRGYFKCMNGQLISRHTCGSQAVFDGNSCVPSPLYQCPNSKQPDLCRKKSDGFISNPQKGCSHYLKCLNGKTIQSLECLRGQYFCPDRKQCVFETFEDNKKCREMHTPGECTFLDSGKYYQDKSIRSSCRKYFFCYNGKRVEFKCPANKIYNGEMCVDESYYTCPNVDPNSCDNKPDGYYKDKSGGCRAYYYCSNAKKYTYLCSEHEIFDGIKCMDKNPGQNCENSDCRGKRDGYYSDLKSNCRNYFFCARGEKITQLTCHGSKIFDGSSCVSADSYACPSTNIMSTGSCMQRKCYRSECKKDGFYSDIDSGCREYFFCIAGKKTSLTCADSFVFNGEICVPNESYQCPKYCSNSPKC